MKQTMATTFGRVQLLWRISFMKIEKAGFLDQKDQQKIYLKFVYAWFLF